MFKEEIKQLAAWQVAERQLRAELKGSDVPRDAQYTTLFRTSDRNKRMRRLAIRLRHLVEGFRSGMPYRAMEAKTGTPVSELHLLIVTLDPTLPQPELRAWLEAPYSHDVRPSPSWHQDFRLRTFTAEGAWMTLPDRLRQKTA